MNFHIQLEYFRIVFYFILFVQGYFHANSIEDTLSRIKRLSRGFIGLNRNIFNRICIGSFFMKCETLHMALNIKKAFLIDYLKIKNQLFKNYFNF